jgi:hypothetical protein
MGSIKIGGLLRVRTKAVFILSRIGTFPTIPTVSHLQATAAISGSLCVVSRIKCAQRLLQSAQAQCAKQL